MNQISIYRNGQKFANIPYIGVGTPNVTQVPSHVMYEIRNWAKGSSVVAKMAEWSWEWQQRGK